MRNKILAIAVIVGAISAPFAAQAQNEITAGIVRGGVVADIDGIADEDRRPAFQEYVIRERVPNYTIPDRVIVGGVLPEAGVTIYDVPQTFGATPYRYTVVNGGAILVEPRCAPHGSGGRVSLLSPIVRAPAHLAHRVTRT